MVSQSHIRVCWAPRLLVLACLFLSLATAVKPALGSCFPAPSGAVGWWPGDGNTLDIAGTNNGVAQGGALTNATGQVGLAFGFNGTNSFIQIPDAVSLKPTNVTVEG